MQFVFHALWQMWEAHRRLAVGVAAKPVAAGVPLTSGTGGWIGMGFIWVHQPYSGGLMSATNTLRFHQWFSPDGQEATWGWIKFSEQEVAELIFVIKYVRLGDA